MAYRMYQSDSEYGTSSLLPIAVDGSFLVEEPGEGLQQRLPRRMTDQNIYQDETKTGRTDQHRLDFIFGDRSIETFLEL